MHVKLTHAQRAGLHMVAKGFRPRTVTIEALINKGLLVGSIKSPRLSEITRQWLEQWETSSSA